MSDAFGQYLQARRKAVHPADTGLKTYGRRRVPGLRREEVASLAGISPDYYVRLEQGRGHQPSAQVIDALARALRLDPPSTLYLHQLARAGQRALPVPAPDELQPGIALLLVTLQDVPAFVQNKFMDVLAATPTAVALSPRNAPGTNLLRAAFLDPAERELYEDWEVVMREATAGLRASLGQHVGDPRLKELVDELSERSALFRDLWNLYEVRPKTAGKRVLHHPVVGTLELYHEKLAITGTDGQLLVVHHAEPGSSSAAALETLAEQGRQGRTDS